MSADQLGHDAKATHFAIVLQALRERVAAIRRVADDAASFRPGYHDGHWVGPDEVHGRNVVGEAILAILDGNTP